MTERNVQAELSPGREGGFTPRRAFSQLPIVPNKRGQATLPDPEATQGLIFYESTSCTT